MSRRRSYSAVALVVTVCCCDQVPGDGAQGVKMDERASGVASLYDYKVLSSDERERARQLRDIYGFEFPVEVFWFWRWHQGLTAPQQAAFTDPLGLSLVGPFDVLAGKFDGVELAYPGVLHYRFADDPPEFVTVFLGQDGRRVGLWFDDHRRLAPVVASYYRDDFTISALGDTMYDATRALIVDCDDGLVEMAEDDPDYADEYAASRRALGELVASLPRADERVPRPPALDTGDGMGVVPTSVGGSAATEALLRGKRLWIDGPRAAGPVLEQAYRLADRPTLAAILSAQMSNPVLPQVAVYDIPVGSYYSLEAALAHPARVRVLGLGDAGLTQLPDLGALIALEDLELYGNQLTDLPASLEACQSLKRINIFRNPMDRVPEVLFKLPALEQIILCDGLPEADVERLRREFPRAEVR